MGFAFLLICDSYPIIHIPESSFCLFSEIIISSVFLVLVGVSTPVCYVSHAFSCVVSTTSPIESS
jgi:hypothetical protein